MFAATDCGKTGAASSSDLPLPGRLLKTDSELNSPEGMVAACKQPYLFAWNVTSPVVYYSTLQWKLQASKRHAARMTNLHQSKHGRKSWASIYNASVEYGEA